LAREDTRDLVDGQDVTQSLLRLMKLQVPELSQISIVVSCGGAKAPPLYSPVLINKSSEANHADEIIKQKPSPPGRL
jgi:hypothetical protein